MPDTFTHDQLLAFSLKNGRSPTPDDDVPIWCYRGWMLTRIAELHSTTAACNDRWGYHMRTIMAGRVLDEPIPKIVFGEANPRAVGLLDTWIAIPGYDLGGWHDLRTFVEWVAFALHVGEDLPALRPEIHRRLYEEVDFSEMLAYPHDYIGRTISIRKSGGWNPGNFYPTPHQVCECMVGMNFHDMIGERDPKKASVCDPCVGTGRLLLHASNYSLNLYGSDIDGLLCTITLINGALYAPWLSYPLPREFFD